MDLHYDRSEVSPSHMAYVQSVMAHVQKEKSSWRSLLSSMCPHNHLPFPKHLRDAITNLLGISFTRSLWAGSSPSETSSPWSNKSTANWEFLVSLRFYCPHKTKMASHIETPLEWGWHPNIRLTRFKTLLSDSPNFFADFLPPGSYLQLWALIGTQFALRYFILHGQYFTNFSQQREAQWCMATACIVLWFSQQAEVLLS